MASAVLLGRRDHVSGPLLHELKLDFFILRKLAEQRLVLDGKRHVHRWPLHRRDRTVRDRHLAAGGIDLLHHADALVHLRFLVGAHAFHFHSLLVFSHHVLALAHLHALALLHVHVLHIHAAHLSVTGGNCCEGRSENSHESKTLCLFHNNASFHQRLKIRSRPQPVGRTIVDPARLLRTLKATRFNSSG